MHGFLSRDGFPPGDLLAIGSQEVQAYGGHLVSGNVQSIRRTDKLFEVDLEGAPPMTSRQVLIATGLQDVLPDIDGVQQRWGRDLLHCPYCHGYEVRDQRLAVLGGSPEAAQHAQLVRQWSRDVVVFPHQDHLPTATREQLTARGITIVEGTVHQLVVTADRLTGVQMDDGRVIARDAVFVRPRFVPNSRLLLELGCAADENGWVIADAAGRTSQPGVWVAGNVTNPKAQVITAAGEGSTAAIAINGDLVDEDVVNAGHVIPEGRGRTGCTAAPRAPARH
jgi:thioredoxin reductase